MPYYAVRPKGRSDAIRIEKATTPAEAVKIAFGRGLTGNWEYQNLTLKIIRSDKKRIAALTDIKSWHLVIT